MLSSTKGDLGHVISIICHFKHSVDTILFHLLTMYIEYNESPERDARHGGQRAPHHGDDLLDLLVALLEVWTKVVALDRLAT